MAFTLKTIRKVKKGLPAKKGLAKVAKGLPTSKSRDPKSVVRKGEMTSTTGRKVGTRLKTTKPPRKKLFD